MENIRASLTIVERSIARTEDPLLSPGPWFVFSQLFYFAGALSGFYNLAQPVTDPFLAEMCCILTVCFMACSYLFWRSLRPFRPYWKQYCSCSSMLWQKGTLQKTDTGKQIIQQAEKGIAAIEELILQDAERHAAEVKRRKARREADLAKKLESQKKQQLQALQQQLKTSLAENARLTVKLDLDPQPKAELPIPVENAMPLADVPIPSNGARPGAINLPLPAPETPQELALRER